MSKWPTVADVALWAAEAEGCQQSYVIEKESESEHCNRPIMDTNPISLCNSSESVCSVQCIRHTVSTGMYGLAAEKRLVQLRVQKVTTSTSTSKGRLFSPVELHRFIASLCCRCRAASPAVAVFSFFSFFFSCPLSTTTTPLFAPRRRRVNQQDHTNYQLLLLLPSPLGRTTT